MGETNNKKAIFGISRHRMGIDGKGITTLVAFMGCPLRCKYCLNDQCHAPVVKDDGRTLRKGVRMLSPEELFGIVKKDNIYFQVTGGGICFGGGEPAMNEDFISGFARLCPGNWKLTIETSLRCSDKTIADLSEYIDEWIVDVKDLNGSIYERYTRVPSEIVQRLRCLKKFVPLNKVTVKVPLIPHFNTREDVEKSISLLKEMGFGNIVRTNYIIKETTLK